VRAVLDGRDALGGAPITVGPHALIHHYNDLWRDGQAKGFLEQAKGFRQIESNRVELAKGFLLGGFDHFDYSFDRVNQIPGYRR
jgi:hypothetical protein